MISGISHRDFDILSKCFNFGEKYHISGKFLGFSGKICSSLVKIGVCPEGGGSGGWSPKIIFK
jgi:hypothetical protein